MREEWAAPAVLTPATISVSRGLIVCGPRGHAKFNTGIAYLSSGLGVKAVLLCVLVVEVVCWREGVARRSWMIRRKAGGMRGWGLAPWTPCLIWARGRASWRPVI
jgi:hypothetical protein